MRKEEEIDKIIKTLLDRGSNIYYLKELRSRSIELIKKDLALKDVLYGIASDIQNKTEMFLSAKNKYGINLISAISSNVYLPDKENGFYKLEIVGGTTKRDNNEFVDFDTKFDLASITKLYTLILLFKLEELGLIDLNARVKDINPDFKYLEDYTLNDLVRLHGILRTNGNIATCNSYEEAYETFKTLYLVDPTRNKNTYTDFGAMALGDTVEKVVSKYLNEELKLDEIMNRYLFTPLGLNGTTYRPGTINVTGNNNDLGLPHDPKARALLGVCAHAGLFSTGDDIIKLSDGLIDGSYLTKKSIDRLGEITFDYSSKGNLGVYVKHPNGWELTYTAPEFSTGSFSHQGWTGGVASFDPNNKIHNSILVNAIYDSPNEEEVVNNKPVGYKYYFSFYQSEITKKIMLMDVIKEYYNKYIGVKENIEDKRIILKKNPIN